MCFFFLSSVCVLAVCSLGGLLLNFVRFAFVFLFIKIFFLLGMGVCLFVSLSSFCSLKYFFIDDGRLLFVRFAFFFCLFIKIFLLGMGVCYLFVSLSSFHLLNIFYWEWGVGVGVVKR